jgi:hypothetical protein
LAGRSVESWEHNLLMRLKHSHRARGSRGTDLPAKCLLVGPKHGGDPFLPWGVPESLRRRPRTPQYDLSGPHVEFPRPQTSGEAAPVQLAPPSAPSCTSIQRLVGKIRHPGGGSAASEPVLDLQHLGRMDGGGSRGGGADRWMEPDHSEWMGGVGGNPVWRVVWSSGAIEHMGPRGEVLLSSAVKPPWTQAGWFAGAGTAPGRIYPPRIPGFCSDFHFHGSIWTGLRQFHLQKSCLRHSSVACGARIHLWLAA